MTDRKIIALSGPKGSGKTTLGQLLFNTNKWRLTSFADPIKSMLTALCMYQDVPDDQTLEMLWGKAKEIPSDAFGGHTPRHAMQTLGSEWRNLISQTLWVDIWQNKINTKELRNANIIVDDLRFEHEADRIHTLGGKVFLIHRPSLDTYDEHSSENEWKEIAYDGVIKNKSTPNRMLKNLEPFL